MQLDVKDLVHNIIQSIFKLLRYLSRVFVDQYRRDQVLWARRTIKLKVSNFYYSSLVWCSIGYWISFDSPQNSVYLKNRPCQILIKQAFRMNPTFFFSFSVTKVHNVSPIQLQKMHQQVQNSGESNKYSKTLQEILTPPSYFV